MHRLLALLTVKTPVSWRPYWKFSSAPRAGKHVISSSPGTGALSETIVYQLWWFSYGIWEAVVHKINLREKLGLIGEHWRPKIVGCLNGQFVKLVKFQGEFVWHHHEHEDELFLVLSGRFRMDFRDRQEWIEEGEFIIVPRGVEHRPFAQQEVSVLLFEPESTLNTGEQRNEFTAEVLDRI
jgi:Cupin domain